MRKMITLIKKLLFKTGRRLLVWGRNFLKFKLKFKHFSKRRKFFLIVLSGFVLIGIYLFITLILISSARLELASLKKRMIKVGPCHEDCLRLRKSSEEKIVSSLKNDKKLRNDLKNYFFENNNSNLAFKKEILKIIALTYGANNPPDFIIDYLIDKNGDASLRAEIISLFLAKTNEPEFVEYYFAILDSEEKIEIKEAAVNALSNSPDKQTIFKAQQIEVIKNLILSDDSDSNKITLHLKANFLFLLSDYFPLFPQETELALTAIFASVQEPILKALTAETLNNFGFSEFKAPEISEAEWEKYFNN